ncbi:MAG TPA: dihydroorotase [Flavisolibacter sp.]|nr:dihydroorotase [Flavisolibacter sp.]
MDILLRQVRIIDPSSPFHQQQVDILIENGKIIQIGTIGTTASREIHIEGLHVSTGWMDVYANFCDPGLEYKETLITGAQAAAAGGYTDVMVLPNTSPVLHNKSGIEYIVQKARALPVTFHPIGAITKNAEGKELAEMYDMHESGAVAFSDGTNTIQSSGILLKALQYLKAIDKTVIQVPDDKAISATGLINEGIESTRLGLAGKPAIAEELMVQRDIELAKYTNSRIHLTGVSTKKSIELIRAAKQEGIAVTCSVTPYHICFCDEDLADYDTNLKVNPPLRTRSDMNAIREALIMGSVDCIATHHLPQDRDHKLLEFEYADYGMTGLETCFAAINTCMPGLPLDKLVSLLSTNPRRIFDLDINPIDVNVNASLSLFVPEQKWTVKTLQTKSKNSPFIGKELTGKPIGIINKDKLFLNEY